MSTDHKHAYFVPGEITPDRIAQSIASHQKKKGIGAHSIFLGQVRADAIGESKVAAIEYSCYEEMARDVFDTIREEAFSKYALTCLHIFHSLGRVEAGQLSLFIFASSPHRQQAVEGCRFVVEKIKSEAPIWGKEILEDETHVWKINRAQTT